MESLHYAPYISYNPYESGYRLKGLQSFYYLSANDLFLSFKYRNEDMNVFYYTMVGYFNLWWLNILISMYIHGIHFFNPWIPESLGALENLPRIENFQVLEVLPLQLFIIHDMLYTTFDNTCFYIA